MPKIFLKFNEQVLKEIPLDKPRLTIGRKPDNDLVIDNPAMSGHHALIFSEEGVFFIEDLGSTNGTFVNDAKIHKEKLKNNDRVALGAHVLIYQDEITPASPPPRETESDKAMLPDPAKQQELVKTVPGTTKTTAVGGKTAEKVWTLADDQILGTVRNELQQILGLRAEPLFARIYKWKSAMAQYGVGHLERLDRIVEVDLSVFDLLLQCVR